MKLAKEQLKQIIKEEMGKIVSTNSLYLAEMSPTSSRDPKEKEDCVNAGNTWMAGGCYDRDGKPIETAAKLEEDSSDDERKNAEAVARLITSRISQVGFGRETEEDFDSAKIELVGDIEKFDFTKWQELKQETEEQLGETLHTEATAKISKQQLKEIIKEELEVILTDEEAREMFGLENIREVSTEEKVTKDGN
tara:strand:- start:135 stop:716 length:582 start_codon:yes stop_codon:yes gene_type:complete